MVKLYFECKMVPDSPVILTERIYYWGWFRQALEPAGQRRDPQSWGWDCGGRDTTQLALGS